MNAKLTSVVAICASLAFAAPALAQEADPEETAEYETYYRDSVIGIGVTLGGALVGFTDSDVNRFAAPGLGWEARLILGTRMFVGGELAYVGTAHAVDAVGLDDGATLLSNGAEGLARVNFSRGDWQPYLVGGAAWRHYNVVSDFNQSSIGDNDDILELPVGLGLAYRFSDFVVDMRGNWRPAVAGSSMMPGDQLLHTWSATTRFGVEF